MCHVEKPRLKEVSRWRQRKQSAQRQPRLAVPGEPLLKAAPETRTPPALECPPHPCPASGGRLGAASGWAHLGLSCPPQPSLVLCTGPGEKALHAPQHCCPKRLATGGDPRPDRAPRVLRTRMQPAGHPVRGWRVWAGRTLSSLHLRSPWGRESHRSQPQGGGMGVGRRGMPHPVPLRAQLSPEAPRLPPLEVPVLPAPTCGSSVPTNMPRYSQPALRPGALPLGTQAGGHGHQPCGLGVARDRKEGDCLVSWLLTKVMGQDPPRRPLAGAGLEGCSPSLGAED